MTDPAEALKRATAHYGEGDIDRAAAICRDVLEAAPDNHQAINLLGGILAARGKFDEAIETLRLGLVRKPENALIRRNLASIYRRRGQIYDALTVARAIETPNEDDIRLIAGLALVIHPHHREAARDALDYAFTKHGTVVLNILNEWISAHGRATDDADLATLGFLYETCPHVRATGLYLMEAWRIRNQLRRAVAIADQLVERFPDFYEAHFNRGLILYALRRFTDAAKSFERAAEQRPDSLGASARAAYAWTRCANWQGAERSTAVLIEKIAAAEKRGEEPNLSPYTAVALNFPADTQLAVARARAAEIERVAGEPRVWQSTPMTRKKRPLRIAYLSADFHNHATTHLICDLFASHDRNHVYVIGYSYGPDVDNDYRRRIVEGCDDFFDLRDMVDADAAEKLADDGVDIAIDLKGYTFGARPGILARRPAPIQVTYLGFPGTMGASFIDYIVTDRIVTPPEHAKYYSEKYVFMPNCYQVNAANQAIDAAPLSREDAGLPADCFVFCCFNRANKIDRESFARWAAILREVPNSVLWLYGAHTEANESLKAAALTAGLAHDRLIFAPALEKSKHLARLALADLFLDTRLISAHTTASDALWAGVPLLAYPGETFMGRVASSLLTAMRLDDLVANSDADYVAKAVALARDPTALAALKERVARARVDSALFRPDLFAQALELAYREMWEIYATGAMPRVIEVADANPQS